MFTLISASYHLFNFYEDNSFADIGNPALIAPAVNSAFGNTEWCNSKIGCLRRCNFSCVLERRNLESKYPSLNLTRGGLSLMLEDTMIGHLDILWKILSIHH